MSKKNRKKVFKYLVGSVAVAAVSAAVIAAAVSCSSVNSSTTTSTNYKSNNTTAPSTSISVTGATSSNGNNYEAPYNGKITLSANNVNLPSGSVTYTWYVNNNVIAKQTTKSSYEVSAGENVNTYYVVTYVNGVQEATSNKVTVTPNFDSSKFSGAIFANVNGSKSMQQVSTINDTNDTQDYTLNYHVLYDGQLLNTTPASVTWTVNGEQTSDTSTSFTVSGLHMGVNTITATTTITIPGQSQTFTIKVATLTINVATLQISGNNVKNNNVSVNYDGSLTLSASKDSLASLTDAGINNPSYQWYEVVNGQTAQPIKGQTNSTLSLTNLTNNATYYLVATWQDNKATNNLMSNQIAVTVNGVQTINPTIVCDNNSTTSPLNLSENNLNQTYKFTINQGNSTQVDGKVTYTLSNTTNNTKVDLSNASSLALNSTYSINFNNLNLTAGDKYQLTATITVPSANGQTTTYNAANNTGLIFDIYYNELSINVTKASTVSEVANTNTYDVAVGSSLTLSANISKVYATGNASYKWETSVNGTSWTKVDSGNDRVNGSTLTISNVGGNDAYYQLVETIGGITLTSNMIKVVPVVSNTVSAQIYSANSNTDTLNIYSQTNAQQTLELDLKNGTTDLKLSDLTNVSIDWYVNEKQVSNNNSLTFTNTYNVGQTNVTVKVSFDLGNKEYSSVATSTNSAANITTDTFTINYYNVDIKATTNSIDYGTNADKDAITFGDDTYMYASPMYQWYVNGKAIGTASATKPTSLPNEVITANTTFQLVITDANNASATAIKSNIINIQVANNDNLTASISNQYGTNGQVTAYSNVTGSTPLSFKLSLDQAGKTYKGSLTNSTITWELNGKSYNEPVSDFGTPFTLPLDALMSGANTLKVTINLSGISTPITAKYTINYAQLTISQPSQIYYDQSATLNASTTNFGNYIAHPYYFWEVNNEVSSTTNSSSFQISNLTTQTTYQLVVGNGSSIASSSIKIYSNPITITPTALSDLSYDIALNGATVNTSTTAHSLTTYTFSLSNLTDNAGMINATNSTGGKVTWTLSDSKGTVTSKNYNLSSESNWSDFAYDFTDYGTYTISAMFSIDNYGTTTLSKTESITFNLTQTQVDVSVSQNSSTLSATTTNSTTAIYDVKYNDGNVTLNTSVANAPTGATYTYQWQSWDATTKSWSNISTNGASQTYTASSKITSNVQYRVQITINNENKIDSTTIELAPQFDSSKFSATITPSMPNEISWDSSTNTLNEYGQVQNKLTVSIDYDGDPISIPTTVTWTNSNITASSSNPLSATLKTMMGTNTISPTITLTLPGENNKTVSVSAPTLTINDAQVVLGTSDSNIYYGQSAKISLTTASANSLTKVGLTNLTYAWYQAKSANETSNGAVINGVSSNTLTINDDKDNGYYYLVVSDALSSTNTITIASNSAISITVGSLSNFNLTGNVTCANSDNTSEASPLQLASANIGTYSFNYNVTSTVSGFNPNAISGTITYKLTNSKGNTITLSTDSENYGSALSIDFSSLANFVPGSYTLTVSGSLNDANGSTLNVPSATYSINYSTVSITSSVGTVNGNTVMVPENDTKVVLSADTDDVFTGNQGYTYQWYSVGSDGTLSAISDAISNTYDVPTTGVNAQEYEVKVTSGDVTITSSPLTLIPSLGSTKPTAAIMTTSGVTSLSIYKSTNATQTLDLNIYENGKLLTTSDVTDLSVTWQVNGKTITADANSLTLTNYQFSIGVNTVSISNLSFKVGNTTYNPKVANFTVTYYALAIKPESTSNITFTNNQATVNYSDPVGSIVVSVNSANTYDTGATSYQWMVSLNGSTYQNVGSSLTTFPTTLPAYNIDEQTSFELVANFADGKTISNPISFAVNSSSKTFSASITNSDDKTSQTAYTTSDSSSTTVKLSLSLNQNGSAYTTYANLTGSTLIWQVKDGENGTWTDINGSATNSLSASEDTSYSYSATISTPGTYYYQAVITLNGISTAITSSAFTLTYVALKATVNVTSSTTNEVSLISTNNYKAYFTGYVNVALTASGFDLSNATYDWTVNGKQLMVNNVSETNDSFMLPINFTSKQTYSVTISVDGQTLTRSFTITPAFNNSCFTTSITSATPTTGTILQNENGTIKEYNVTQNALTYNVYYNGELLNSIDSSAPTPSITWTATNTNSSTASSTDFSKMSGISANYATQMGTNSITATATINLPGVTLSTTTLTIYNAMLQIQPKATSVVYGQTTSISITSASQQSLNEVFNTSSSTTSTASQNNQAFLDAFSSGIANNVSNFGGSGQSGEDFVTNILNEWMAGWKLNNATYSDFSNWNASWYPTKIQGYTVLALSAYSNTPLTPQYWDQSINNGHGGGETMNYTIPTGTYFTWTLPYYQGGISTGSNNSTITNTPITYSTYFDANTGAPNPNWTTPLGLALGSLSNPTAISGGSEFTNYHGDTSHNGFIGIGYQSNTTNFTPTLTFNYPKVTYTWTANDATVANSGISYTPTAIDQDTTYDLTVSYAGNTLSATTKVDVTNLPTLTPSLTCTNSSGQSVTSPIELDSNNLSTYDFDFSLSPKLNLSGNITWTLVNTKTNSSITLANNNVAYNNTTNTYSINFSTLKDFVPGSYTLTATAKINDLGGNKVTYDSTFTINNNVCSIKGKITCNEVTGNTDVVYGKGSDYSIDLTFSLLQNNNPFTALTGTTYAWSYTTPNGTKVNVGDVTSTTWDGMSSALDADGTYTITATATLPGNVVVSATFTVKYTAITISNTPAYYGYNTTLSSNITGAKSYAWHLVTNGIVESSSIGSDATYSITGITTDQSYQLWVTGTNGQTYKSTTYTVDVKPWTDLTATTTYATNGYAQWFANYNLQTWVQTSGFNNFIIQYMSGYQLDPSTTYSDFTNYKLFFKALPSDDGFGNQQFLTIQATSTSQINLYTWSNQAGSFLSSKNYAPKGSVFTWTLPYELSQMYDQDGTIGIPEFSSSNWWNYSSYKDTIATPFGLSIGNETNLTAVSAELSGTTNGVITIAYGYSQGSPYNPPLAFYNTYTSGAATPIAFTNIGTGNTVNINSNSLITFQTSATTIGGNVTSTTFTNNGSALNASCTYTIMNGSNTVISGGTIYNDQGFFSFDFTQPGQYKIEVTYSIPNVGGTKSSVETYYVNYNQVAISVPNNNPKVGSTVTLSANNTNMYASTTDATYQWLRIIDGKATLISDATKSTYNATLNVYNQTYTYELQETIAGITYTSAPVTLIPNDSELTLSATISNSHALNGNIDIISSENETFDLSATFSGETYNATTPLSGATITWYVNGDPISTDSNKWSITYDPTSQGVYAIKAIIAVTAYGDSDIPNATSNTITINYASEMGTLNIDTPTTTSPYVYNKSESKLVIWGNGTNTPDTTSVGFSVTGLSATNASDYEVEFINGSKNNVVALTNLTFSGSTDSFSLPVSDFDGYTSLKLINKKTNIPASQTIAYTYLPQKPWFKIEPGSSITVANPQITLVPNENLGSATLGAISAQDLSFSLDVNGTTIGITPVSGSSTNATISIDGHSLTYDNFYTVSINNNVNYQVDGQTITCAAYVISFDAAKFKQLISYADCNGTWTTIQVNTTLSGVTLDGEPITGTNPVTQTFGYANTNSNTNDMYTAGVYWNNVPVTSVPQGASNVTLQLKGTLSSGATIQWVQVTSQGTVDLTNATNATYDLSAANLQTSGMLTYEAQITSDGNTITTNQCTVNVTDLGQATINIESQTASQVISPTNSIYDLTSGTTYKIQTSNQSGVTLNDTQSGVNTYYQWQYMSNSIILNGTASNGTWTNLGNATSTYQPYSYTAVPMYSVSFRLVVFTDSSTPTTFNAQTNTQYIVSNVINTYAAFNCTFDVVTSTSSVKGGTAVTYTLNPSDQQALMLLVKNCEYNYDTYNSSSSSYDNNTFYPVTVTWYYKLSSASSYTTVATLSITIVNGKLAFVGGDSLSYTFSGSDFSTAGTYDIYAKITFTDNFNTSSSNTASLTVTSSTSHLDYNYEAYMEAAIKDWINEGTTGVANTSLNGTQSQSTFIDFIQQNGVGYEVHATSSDFDNYKVSFTATPSADVSELGSNEWLTITATATTTIDMYYWQSTGTWGASGGTTVASGSQFMWTLPYATSSITYSSVNGKMLLSMALNSNYGNTNNENLPVPFGLSVGTSADPTSISKTWSYTKNSDGVLVNNYGTNGESFTLPSPWVVPYTASQAVQYAIVNWAQASTSNIYNNQSGTSFTDFVQQNTQGVKILNSGDAFDDFQVSFNEMPSSDASALGSYADAKWLTITAISTQTIHLTTWQGSSWGTNTVVSVLPGYVFTWTLPYTESTITYADGVIQMPINTTALYEQNNTDGNSTANPSVATSDTLTIPFGLSIGTASNPTSVSSTWSSDATLYDGRICTNFQTGNETFTIPTTWEIQCNQTATFASLTNANVTSTNSSLLFTDEVLTNWNK